MYINIRAFVDIAASLKKSTVLMVTVDTGRQFQTGINYLGKKEYMRQSA